MAEYIERERVYNALKAKYCDECTDKKCQTCDYADIMFVIDNLPAADVQPIKHGYWEEVTDYGGWGDTHYRCSVCGNEWYLEDGTPKDNNMNGCPRCLARMDGEQK